MVARSRKKTGNSIGPVVRRDWACFESLEREQRAQAKKKVKRDRGSNEEGYSSDSSSQGCNLDPESSIFFAGSVYATIH